MSEREKVFVGEQFFHQDLYPNLELDGTAVSETYGPFDWQDVKGRQKVVAEIFGDNGAGTAAGDAVSVTVQGSKDGGANWVTRASGTAAAGTGTDANGMHIIESGSFIDYVEADPDYKHGQVVVSVTAGITGATLKAGLALV